MRSVIFVICFLSKINNHTSQTKDLKIRKKKSMKYKNEKKILD